MAENSTPVPMTWPANLYQDPVLSRQGPAFTAPGQVNAPATPAAGPVPQTTDSDPDSVPGFRRFAQRLKQAVSSMISGGEAGSASRIPPPANAGQDFALGQLAPWDAQNMANAQSRVQQIKGAFAPGPNPATGIERTPTPISPAQPPMPMPPGSPAMGMQGPAFAQAQSPAPMPPGSPAMGSPPTGPAFAPGGAAGPAFGGGAPGGATAGAPPTELGQADPIKIAAEQLAQNPTAIAGPETDSIWDEMLDEMKMSGKERKGLEGLTSEEKADIMLEMGLRMMAAGGQGMNPLAAFGVAGLGALQTAKAARSEARKMRLEEMGVKATILQGKQQGRLGAEAIQVDREGIASRERTSDTETKSRERVAQVDAASRERSAGISAAASKYAADKGLEGDRLRASKTPDSVALEEYRASQISKSLGPDKVAGTADDDPEAKAWVAQDRLRSTASQPALSDDAARIFADWTVNNPEYALADPAKKQQLERQGLAQAQAVDPNFQPAQQYEDAPTDPAQRQPGTVYRTPKGNFLWSGEGWQPLNAGQ